MHLHTQKEVLPTMMYYSGYVPILKKGTGKKSAKHSLHACWVQLAPDATTALLLKIHDFDESVLAANAPGVSIPFGVCSSGCEVETLNDVFGPAGCGHSVIVGASALEMDE